MRYLVVIGALFWATAGMAEELIVQFDESGNAEMVSVTETDSGIVWQLPELACIDTELCGDRVDDSEVRCVRVRICGEPIR
jgi:hypothetical protein